MDDDTSMLTAPASDRSVQILDALFGPGWQNMFTGGGDAAGHASAISALLHSFNLFLLGILGLIIGFVFVRAIVSTAHEGTPLGQAYSSLWTPIRSVMAMLLLAPIPGTGLCFLQGLILLFVSYGIGGASYLWSTALDHMDRHHGAVHASPSQDGMQVAGAITELAIAYVYAARYHDGARWEWSGSVNDQLRLDLRVVSRPETYGGITINCDAGPGPCSAHADAVKEQIEIIVPAMQTVADWTHDLEVDTSGVPEMLAYAARRYNSRTADLYSDYIAQQVDTRDLGTVTDSARSEGWTMAGAYWWSLTRRDSAVAEAIRSNVDIDHLHLDRYEEIVSHSGSTGIWGQWHRRALEDLKLATKRHLALLRDSFAGDAAGESDQTADRGSTASEDPGILDRLAGAAQAIKNYPAEIAEQLTDEATTSVRGTVIGMLRTHTDALSSDDPLSALARAGQKMIDWAIPMLGISGVTSAMPFIGSVGEIGMSAGTTLLIAGLFLAYWIPMLPYVYWIIGVVGWFVLVAQALIAAPLWAIMHALPDGDGPIAGGARPGYMLVMNMLARPPIMILSLVITMALISLIMPLVGHGFSLFTTIFEENSISTIGALAYIGIVTLISLAVTHKLFSFMSEAPDKVMAFVGQLVQPLAGEGDARQMSGTMYAGASAAGGAVGGAVGSVGRAGGEAGSKASSAVASRGGDASSSAGGGRDSDHMPGTYGGGNDSVQSDDGGNDDSNKS